MVYIFPIVFVSLFICLYNIYVSSQNHENIKTKKVVGIWKMDKNICPKTNFPTKNLAKKYMICIFTRSCSHSLFFHRKLPLQPFFGEFWLGLLSNNLGKTSSSYPKNGKNVIQLPENWEKRHPVTQKAGKTSSSYPKIGKNVIRFVQSCEMQSPDDLYERIIERNQTNLFL